MPAAVITLVFEKSSQSVRSPAGGVLLDRGLAERFEEREPPVARERDLRAGIAAFRDLPRDQRPQAIERRLVESELVGARGLEREVVAVRGAAGRVSVMSLMAGMSGPELSRG